MAAISSDILMSLNLRMGDFCGPRSKIFRTASPGMLALAELFAKVMEPLAARSPLMLAFTRPKSASSANVMALACAPTFALNLPAFVAPEVVHSGTSPRPARWAMRCTATSLAVTDAFHLSAVCILKSPATFAATPLESKRSVLSVAATAPFTESGPVKRTRVFLARIVSFTPLMFDIDSDAMVTATSDAGEFKSRSTVA